MQRYAHCCMHGKILARKIVQAFAFFVVIKNWSEILGRAQVQKIARHLHGHLSCLIHSYAACICSLVSFGPSSLLLLFVFTSVVCPMWKSELYLILVMSG